MKLNINKFFVDIRYGVQPSGRFFIFRIGKTMLGYNLLFIDIDIWHSVEAGLVISYNYKSFYKNYLKHYVQLSKPEFNEAMKKYPRAYLKPITSD